MSGHAAAPGLISQGYCKVTGFYVTERYQGERTETGRSGSWLVQQEIINARGLSKKSSNHRTLLALQLLLYK